MSDLQDTVHAKGEIATGPCECSWSASVTQLPSGTVEVKWTLNCEQGTASGTDLVRPNSVTKIHMQVGECSVALMPASGKQWKDVSSSSDLHSD